MMISTLSKIMHCSVTGAAEELSIAHAEAVCWDLASLRLSAGVAS